MTQKINENELVEMIFSTLKVLKEKIKNQYPDNQFSHVQLGTMKFILEHKNPTMRQVADFLSVSAPSATSFVDTLIKGKQLERVLDKKDRRLIRVKLTQKGKKDLENILKDVRSEISQVLQGLNQEEQLNLEKILKKLNKNLK